MLLFTAVGLLCLAQPVLGAVLRDTARLDLPVVTNNTVHLVLTGETGVEYVIQSTSDLQTWTDVVTNSDAQITRTFDLGPAADAGFYRTARRPLPVFAAALAATEQIDFNGKNVRTDSFDSSDPLFSDNGLYPASQPERQKDNGHVITDGFVTNSLGVASAQIKGMIRTGPGLDAVITANSSVGDKAWVEGGNFGIQPGHFADDMNVNFKATQLPSATWVMVPYYSAGVTIEGDSYNWVIDTGGDYYISDLSKSLHVTGNVRLFVFSKLSLTNANNRIRIAPGSSLKMYVLCGFAIIAGAGVVNSTGDANNFHYYGLPSNTNFTYAGSVDFTGVVYAPQAAFTVGGGGADFYDFDGASVTRSVKMNGHYQFHFDENLLRAGPAR